MCPFFSKALGPQTTSLSSCTKLIKHCLFKSSDLAKSVHAHLIKIGFNSNTFLGNCLLDLYTRFGTTSDALAVFHEISEKNSISSNIILKELVRVGLLRDAFFTFLKMPNRDVVSWNTMISGYASNGFVAKALETFHDMQNAHVRPSAYTLSILLSFVSYIYHGKQIHGKLIRRHLNLSNIVLMNSLIKMYGKLELIDYVFGVFLTMEKLDVISWNSLLRACYRTGHMALAVSQFCLMRPAGNLPDQFTVSIMFTICSNLQNLELGIQIFSLCVKVGFFSNSIVSSAAIDLFSKCNSFKDSLKLFEEIRSWDLILCNSMISSYARHGLKENALQLFIMTLRENLRPTEFTLSIVLSCVSMVHPVEHGSQIHCLVIKSGWELDDVVATSLVEMYAKYGLIDLALEIFSKTRVRDLIAWNTIIVGLAHNGRPVECLVIFKELLSRGLTPDRVTLTGVLLACNYGKLVDEGLGLLLSMEKEFGIVPEDTHYACIVELMTQTGNLKEAMDIIRAMPREPNASTWGSLLRACVIYGDLKLIETVAERMSETNPLAVLPYLILAHAYERRGRWESTAKMRRVMKERGLDKVSGCSWIGIRNNVYVFRADQLLQYGGYEVYEILKLLIGEMERFETC